MALSESVHVAGANTSDLRSYARRGVSILEIVVLGSKGIGLWAMSTENINKETASCDNLLRLSFNNNFSVKIIESTHYCHRGEFALRGYVKSIF